ncbi:MAG TPA: energy transducer TonB, partial [Blastocatellia bacterium]
SRVYLMLAMIVGPDNDEKGVARFFDSFTPLYASAPPSELAPPPPAPRPVPTIPKDAIEISGGLLQASAVKKVEPEYPPIARAAHAEGAVGIQITISEVGKVIEAEVVTGHPLLRDAALKAARQWEFNPTERSGKPVKVAGVLTFHFTLK